ncbi:hypothetical protein VNO78_14347 [Psophocarpus tetragonolobus]|uniref:Transmembrane protein n=1 Tax=Psophocarpus tetragonolobus TaxID=3891 RepID=A0AAN9SR21_PSOTE
MVQKYVPKGMLFGCSLSEPNIVVNFLSYNIGDGKTVDFWLYSWVPRHVSLFLEVVGDITHDLRLLKVSECVDANGDWNFNMFEAYWSFEILDSIRVICGNDMENLDYVFRLCPLSREVWYLLLPTVDAIARSFQQHVALTRNKPFLDHNVGSDIRLLEVGTKESVCGWRTRSRATLLQHISHLLTLWLQTYHTSLLNAFGVVVCQFLKVYLGKQGRANETSCWEEFPAPFISLIIELKMVILNRTNGLVSIIVIIVLIFPEVASHALSPSDSVADNVSEAITQPDNTTRVDPLDHFEKYRGGFNITNKHYWSSVIFVGVYGYAIGVFCLLCGIVYGSFLLISMVCQKIDKGRRMKKVSPCNYKSCDLSLIPLAILLTAFAIAATGLVLAGSARFHSEAKASVNIIIKTANEASETIHKTTGALKDMESNFMEANANTEASVNLDSTTERLDDASANIEMQARKNRTLINKGLELVFVITTVIISLNLPAVIALSASGVLRLRRAMYLLVILCWLMTVICWLFFGVYFFLEKFSSDACTALDNFQENPYNNSLSSILPCDELLSAKSVLSGVSAGIYNLVNEVNANITAMQSTSDMNLVRVCNPFSAPPEYSYQPEKCPSNTIRIGDIPKVLKPFTCTNGNDGTCDSEYMRVEAYTSSIQDLLNVYPSMEHLLECQVVKDAFSQVLVNHCKPLKKYARMVWVGLLFLAVIMVLLVVLWTIKARYYLSDDSASASASVDPHCAPTKALQSGSVKEIEI